jgi:hypothetical protein
VSDLLEVVQKKYGQAARRAASGAASSCCGSSSCGTGSDPITRDLYAVGETQGLPSAALLASLGCGNPTALASSMRAKRYWTLAPVVGSTSSCLPGEWVRPGRRMGST